MGKQTKLGKYYCSKCGSIPISSEEILREGCRKCGNGFFKVKKGRNQEKKICDDNVTETCLNKNEKKNVTISVENRGVYEINIKDLLDANKPVIVGGKGVYRVSLKSTKNLGNRKRQ